MARAFCLKNLLASGICIIAIFSSYPGARARTAKENLNFMKKLSAEQGGVIEGNDELFSKYIKSKHTKYSVVTMFNAVNPKHGCEICQEARNELVIVAQSYAAAAERDHNIFFVVIDYDNAPMSFMKMDLTHAPEVMFFSRDRNKRKHDKYDSARNGMTATSILKWLREVSGVKVYLKKTIPWLKIAILGAFLVSITIGALIKPYFFLRIITSTTLWGIVILLCVLTMISGQMWNSIRNASNYGRHRTGEMRLIYESESGQFRYESYIIILLNGGISLGFILLNQASEIKEYVFLRKIVGFIGLCLVTVIFGYLISIFRMKSRGYPYFLLFE